MPRHITIAFPGQGSQFLGMLNHFQDDLIENLKSDISNSLDFNIIDLIKYGPDEKLNKTSFTQPAILLASYLEYKLLKERLNIQPDLVCGHSLGEYSALLAAESFNLNDALNIVHKRGSLMEKSAPGSMYAILNTELDIIRECCLRASSELNKISSPANINSKKQVVISGHSESVELSVKYLKERGARKCLKLNVSVASHCELMNEAASSFEEVIDESAITNPKYNFLNNYDACFINEISDIKEKLVKQLTSPVQWVNIMELVKKREGIFIECGPKNILSGLAKANGVDNIYSTSSENFYDEIKKIL
tara:strand:+ start:4193 stop:5113 length:921 start_codon:yes stop_codon:yes gene_type:complete